MAALGILETRGYSAAVEALDAMCKDARVSVREVRRPGGGHIALLIEGEVAAVTSAVEAGTVSAQRVGGELIFSNIIANPHKGLAEYLERELSRNG